MSAWVDQMFELSKQARAGGVVRRSVAVVERLGVLDEIIVRASREGMHVLETGGNIVLLAHEGTFKLHC
jgi:hypothetical protein